MILALLFALSQDSSRLTLETAVSRALSRYPQVAAAHAAREHAAADLGESRAALLPRLTLDGNLTHYQKPGLVFPLHSLPTGPGSALPLFDNNLVQGSLTASWTLWDFGQRSSRIRAARLSASAADASVDSVEQAVIARTAAGYLAVLTARGVLAAQDERLAALAAESSRTNQVLAAGKAARIDLLRVTAELERARADRIATASRVDVAERDLAQLVDLPIDSIHRGALAGLGLLDTTLATRDSLMAAARAASPALLQAHQRAQAAAANAGIARGTRFPELRLQGRYLDFGRTAGDFESEWQAGVLVTWPLFTGGARSSQISRSDADARAAQAQAALAELAVAGSLDRTLASLREARARTAALEQAVAQSAEVVHIERLSLDVGSGTQSDFLEAEANLLSARASLVEARHAAITARVDLARITGELSPEWLRRTLVEQQP